jgi:dTDP-4-dehydrorhamnose reductase
MITQPGPIFVTGATGYLGHELTRLLDENGFEYELWGRAEGYDLAQPFALDERVRSRWEELLVAGERRHPLLIHLAAESRWGACEEAPELAQRVNAESSGVLAAAIASAGGRMVLASTDLVFDGERAPYEAGHEPRPHSTYGRTKRAAEWYVLGADAHLVLRLPLLYGPSFDGRRGASDMVLRAAEEGRTLKLFVDEWRTPMHVARAAQTLLESALRYDLRGVLHPQVEGRCSRWELGRRIAEEAGLDADAFIEMASRHEMSGPARPEDTALVPGHAERA